MDRGFAPAKVNLALHVTGRSADGYHRLDSLVVFAGSGDQLSATPARDLTLSVSGPFAMGLPTARGNLVYAPPRRCAPPGGWIAGAAIPPREEPAPGGGPGRAAPQTLPRAEAPRAPLESGAARGELAPRCCLWARTSPSA
jgi:4-diphosphocytidyl-2-C-methyl-D-erythritol kinase